MLAMDKFIPEGRKVKKKEKSEKEKERGKNTSEKSIELNRTHSNIFDWVQKEK